MNEQEFQQRWADRAERYPDAQPLPSDRTLHIDVDPGYAGTYAGQVAAITAASLFGRMTVSVAFDVPSCPVLDPLPWAGVALDEVVAQTLGATHPYGRHERRQTRRDDIRVVVGPGGDGLIVHGSGWSAYRGTEPSPLEDSDELNPFGAAFAVIAAAAQLQLDPSATAIERALVDTYRWRAGMPSAEVPKVSPGFELGELWCVGVGSVGSCALFFLSLITCAFDAVLVDKDAVKVENVTRSALFSWRDAIAETPKVEVARRWLSEAGVGRTEPHFAWLHEITERWSGRRAGTPDVLISAANEWEVRSLIEVWCPPLQVYATTGRNWQATLFRHAPLSDACSRCIPDVRAPQIPALCATGSQTVGDGSGGGDDVALPFLSYAAGVMTAAELAKLALTGRPVTPNRVFFEPRNPGLVRGVALGRRSGCPCQQRDPTVHRAAIEGSRFASLSA